MMKSVRRAVLCLVMVLVGLTQADLPNPACLVPYPYHCDPPPKS